MPNGRRRRGQGRGRNPRRNVPDSRQKQAGDGTLNPVPAVPERVRELIDRAEVDAIAPGHRFSLFFPIWKAGTWKSRDGAKRDGLQAVCGSGGALRELAEALTARQRCCAERPGEAVIAITARNTSPFVTGLGMEHPVENGFAFLVPYGLPYLPGASVKGALRRAAERLALEEEEKARKGWDLLALWWLFGFDATAAIIRGPQQDAPQPVREWAEAERKAAHDRAARLPQELFAPFARTMLDRKERDRVPDTRAFLEEATKPAFAGGIHNRGALHFWDVFPVPAEGNGLGVDIVTPHHGGYYQGQNSPHKSENPIPNPFLVLEPGASFHFHVAFRPPAACPDGLRQHWRELVAAAFTRLFEEGGFGAKTSVGYGVLEAHDAELAAVRDWIERTVAELMASHKINSRNQVFKSRPFAEQWSAIADEGLRGRVRAYLEAEVWPDPLRKPSRRAMEIYNTGSGDTS